MKSEQLYTFLHRQILLLISLTLGPGIAYIILGWIYGIVWPAITWYLLVLLSSLWGFRLYKAFLNNHFSDDKKEAWYQELSYFFYGYFGLWTLIFYFYVSQDVYELHYIAIFTQIGASTVAATILSSDRKLYIPVLLILMVPLILYFTMIGEWYSYVLSLFSTIFLGVLYYSSTSSYNLLQKSIYQAMHDQLTGLYSRHYFIDYLQSRINLLRHTNEYAYLLLIDLDHFKTINDSLGHDIGDKLLIDVTRRMYEVCGKEHMIARLGGDEFIIIGKNHLDKEQCVNEAMEVSAALLEALKRHYVIDLHHLYISASIGASLISSHSINANRFIKEADIAMYEVKAQGRDGVFLFDEAMSLRIEQNLEIERLLHFALPRNEISLVYQPQVDLEKRVVGSEVLVRWNSEALGTVAPDAFIPIAEQTGLIVELGRHIVEEAFKTLQEWDRKGIVLDQFSINISMRQFFHHNFVNEIQTLCETYLNEELRSKLVFEMTETLVAEDIAKVVEVMNCLKALGIHFSMDDFGTGYSSLSYIKNMPIDEIKIDRSFVSELGEASSDKAMITTILNMAKIFGLKVVAEGVETKEQKRFLMANQCDLLQGFLFSKPLQKEEYEKFYFAHKPA